MRRLALLAALLLSGCVLESPVAVLPEDGAVLALGDAPARYTVLKREDGAWQPSAEGLVEIAPEGATTA